MPQKHVASHLTDGRGGRVCEWTELRSGTWTPTPPDPAETRSPAPPRGSGPSGQGSKGLGTAGPATARAEGANPLPQGQPLSQRKQCWVAEGAVRAALGPRAVLSGRAGALASPL